MNRDTEVLELLTEPKCLVKLKSGKPGHPLYKRNDLTPSPLHNRRIEILTKLS